MRREGFDKILTFFADLLEHADIGIDAGAVRIGVMSYSTKPHIHIYMDMCDCFSKLVRAIDRVTYIHGRSNPADALKVMRSVMFSKKHGDRANVTNMAVYVTDRQSNLYTDRIIPEALRTQSKNIGVFTVGIGLKDRDEIKSISSNPDELYSFFVDSVDNLDSIRNELFYRLFSGE